MVNQIFEPLLTLVSLFGSTLPQIRTFFSRGRPFSAGAGGGFDRRQGIGVDNRYFKVSFEGVTADGLRGAQAGVGRVREY